jgi:hypothetical protein
MWLTRLSASTTTAPPSMIAPLAIWAMFSLTWPT